MLLLAAAAALISPASSPRPQGEAVAGARILKPSAAGSRTWNESGEGQRREVRIRDEQGRELLLRLVENE
jgi:hypothetical protein